MSSVHLGWKDDVPDLIFLILEDSKVKIFFGDEYIEFFFTFVTNRQESLYVRFNILILQMYLKQQRLSEFNGVNPSHFLFYGYKEPKGPWLRPSAKWQQKILNFVLFNVGLTTVKRDK